MPRLENVTPGINPLTKTDHFNDDEKKIIKRLSLEWYITHGGDILRPGYKSEYKYFLIKPIPRYQEMFNIEREIIVVFSAYETFEPRTLDAIDIASKYYQSLRLERICSVLISKDNDIENKLRDLLKNDQESQIVIPFSYDELLKNTNDDYFIRNRFKKHFYTRDLFAFEAPLKRDLYFFGRDDLIHKIANRHRSNENSGLFGLRKTGKTSVIFGVARALSKMDGISVFIDCQSPAFHRRRWNSALHYILEEIKRQNRLKIELPGESSYTEENAPILFEKEIKKAYNKLEHKSILIIFDEIENITFDVSPTEHWSKGMDFIFFWQTLRSAFQKLNNVFSYLIVGTNSMCIESPTIHNKDNPIFNQVPFEYIPRFDVPQTREMVRKLGAIMGLTFDEIIFGKLTEDFGGHPFLMRHVCSVINRICSPDRPTRVDKATYEKAKEIFNREHSNYIEMILTVLQQFYNDEYAMMEFLAREDLEAFLEFAKMSPYYTNHLLGYGIIEKSRDTYSFRIEAIKEYLLNKQKYKKINLTLDEMFREISERRNLLEPKIRIIIKNQLHAIYGKSQAKRLVLDIIGDPRKTEYDSRSYEELFDTKLSSLYFEDLRKIIFKNWDCFKHIFSKGKDDFNTKMQVINKYRSDAHAKELTLDEMSYFRVCITAIEQQVKDFLG